MVVVHVGRVIVLVLEWTVLVRVRVLPLHRRIMRVVVVAVVVDATPMA